MKRDVVVRRTVVAEPLAVREWARLAHARGDLVGLAERPQRLPDGRIRAEVYLRRREVDWRRVWIVGGTLAGLAVLAGCAVLAFVAVQWLIANIALLIGVVVVGAFTLVALRRVVGRSSGAGPMIGGGCSGIHCAGCRH